MQPANAEIKATVSKAAVDQALDLLQLQPSDAEKLQVCFAEDSPDGVTPQTRLLNEHIILRARQRPDDRDDCTVKIRPCRISQITPKLLALSADEDSGFKLEADWAGDNVLAASFTVDLPGHPVARARAERKPLSSLFTNEQADFLRDCADAQVNLEALTLLDKTVIALRWKPSRFDGATTADKIRAERWSVGELDFLELSILAPVADAQQEQAKLIVFLHAKGIQPPDVQVTKTQQVLRVLVGAPAQPAG
jgi:hypothetical protein